MTAPRWVRRDVIVAFHDMTIATHGGAAGLRDGGLLDAAIDRPRNLYAYGAPDIYDLAAAYAFGIAKAHAFVDGNKRSAYIAARTFILLNGGKFAPSQISIVTMMNGLASDQVDIAAFTGWLHKEAAG